MDLEGQNSRLPDHAVEHLRPIYRLLEGLPRKDRFKVLEEAFVTAPAAMGITPQELKRRIDDPKLIQGVVKPLMDHTDLCVTAHLFTKAGMARQQDRHLELQGMA